MPGLAFMDKKRVAVGIGNHGHKTDARFVQPINEGDALGFKQSNGVAKVFHLEALPSVPLNESSDWFQSSSQAFKRTAYSKGTIVQLIKYGISNQI